VFFGEYEYRVDEKGRIPLPPRFRPYLKDGVVLFAGVEKCITAYNMIEWKKLSEKLVTGTLGRSKDRRLNRAIFASAFYQSIDSQGRVAIPQPLRYEAMIGEDAIVIGLNTYIEIWSVTEWLNEKAEAQKGFWQILETLEGTG
jgi:MraZ protein